MVYGYLWLRSTVWVAVGSRIKGKVSVRDLGLVFRVTLRIEGLLLVFWLAVMVRIRAHSLALALELVYG